MWGAWFVFGTTTGTRQWLPVALRRLIPAKTLHIGHIDGTLLKGLRLSQVSIAGLPGWWGNSQIAIGEVSTDSIAQLLARRGGLSLRDVNWADAPFAAQVGVQRIDIRWPFQLEHVQLIDNARVRLPLSEPILLAGTQREGRFNVTLYAKTLDVHEVTALMTRATAWQSLMGVVHDLEVRITGPLRELTWNGSVHAVALTRYDFTMSDCPATFSLTMRGLPQTLETDGTVACEGGSVSSRQTVAALLPSAVTFSTKPSQAAFDVHATSTVGGTPIRIALRGTTAQPDLRLTSTPPLPQGVLLAMLVTGRQWKGAQDALTQGVISSDLALDFIDYFALNGFGSTLANRFGISGLSLRHHPGTNRVGVETTLVEKLSVGVEVEPSTFTSKTSSTPSTSTDVSAPTTRMPIPYKVGAEYKLNETTAVRLEGERTVLDTTASRSASTTDTETAPTGPQTDDKVLLKFKKQF